MEVKIRPTQPSDAAQLLQVMRQIGSETDFLIMDENGLSLTEEQLSMQLAAFFKSPNNLSLVALVDDEIIGIASVLAEENPRVAHIGEVGISILKEFWGMGLGAALMEEIILWAESSGIIRRLELTVQTRNQRALHLYQKFGFIIEGEIKRSFLTPQNEFIPAYLMALLID
ncbi:N-acetyltransferase [Enterococcus saigonensis]|uniref:N-acetyltransferase n=1 Tax=Enterococcus saigonensis TaxID=1805431 RepID=A0A679IQR3_9ENTE|nr:N-acetyltransferase [Enterococcus saigonensis]